MLQHNRKSVLRQKRGNNLRNLILRWFTIMPVALHYVSSYTSIIIKSCLMLYQFTTLRFSLSFLMSSYIFHKLRTYLVIGILEGKWEKRIFIYQERPHTRTEMFLMY